MCWRTKANQGNPWIQSDKNSQGWNVYSDTQQKGPDLTQLCATRKPLCRTESQVVGAGTNAGDLISGCSWSTWVMSSLETCLASSDGLSNSTNTIQLLESTLQDFRSQLTDRLYYNYTVSRPWQWGFTNLRLLGSICWFHWVALHFPAGRDTEVKENSADYLTDDQGFPVEHDSETAKTWKADTKTLHGI